MLADVLLDRPAQSTSQLPTIAEIQVSYDDTHQVVEVLTVTVAFTAGEFDCRWTGGFRREVIDAGPQTLQGAQVLVVNGVVLGSIYPRGT